MHKILLRIDTGWLALTAAVCFCATLFVCKDALTADRIGTFKLESMDRAHVYGPFELSDGQLLLIDEQSYAVLVESDREIKFRSLSSAEVFGPYEFVIGRIVKIGQNHYTVVDISKAPVPEPETKPAKVSPTPSEAKPRPAMQVAKQPAPIEPLTPARPQPVRMRPVPDSAGKPLLTRSEEPVTSRQVAGPPPRTTEVGLEVLALDRTLYDVDIGNVLSLSRTSISRQRLCAFFRRRPIVLWLGATLGGEWSEDVSGPVSAFSDAGMADGKGWSASLEYGHDIYRNESWRVTMYGEARYLREQYSLEYEQWVSLSFFVPGTNGTGRMESFREQRGSETDLTLSESSLGLGLRFSREKELWWCYGSLEAIPLVQTDIDGSIVAGGESFDIKFDQSLPFSVIAGAGIKRHGWRLYVEGRAGGDLRLSLGLTRSLSRTQ